MIANLIIALAELRKLALLYLLIKYGWHSPEGIIGAWLSWQFASAILLGILSDKIGRKPVLYFTIFFSILVGVFATSSEYFFIALLIDGVCVATLPVTFAAKNDQHPLRDKRLTYAEASLARAAPWFVFPLIYLLMRMPENFWEASLIASALLSGGFLIFFKDPEDNKCEELKKHAGKPRSVWCWFVVAFLLAFFVSECSFQTSSYLAEDEEPVAKMMRSYLLFGLGMSTTCAAQLFIRQIKDCYLTLICEKTFLLTSILIGLGYIASLLFSPHNNLVGVPTYLSDTILADIEQFQKSFF